LESAVGIDYIPLLTALQLQEFDVADQLTRDLLLEIGGEQIKKQGFVYFAQVKLLPVKDMLTIDNLWVAYSRGKFGYSVQKKIWNGKKDASVIREWKSLFGYCCRCERVQREASEEGLASYSYDLKTAPKGHLPLTSALRGKLQTRDPKHETRDPKPETRDPRPETRDPRPETLNPGP
ncbi:hypothetical protein T484DRAFT_1613096, partial [Baffinella frigidus]